MKTLDEIEKSLHGAYSSSHSVTSDPNSELLWMQKKETQPVKKNTEEQDTKEKSESLPKSSDEEVASLPIKKPKQLTILQIEEQIDFLKQKIVDLKKYTLRVTERTGRNGNMAAFDAHWEGFKKEKQECEDQILILKGHKAMSIEENTQQVTFLMGCQKK